MKIEKLPIDFKGDIINKSVNERRKYNLIKNEACAFMQL